MSELGETTGAGASRTTVQAFHHKLRPRPADAFLVLRALALSLGPDVSEHVTEGAVRYLRRDRAFMTVHHARTKLNVAFPPQVDLQDPNGRLLRRGEEKYVAVEGPESVDGHVQEFVRKSYAALR